MPSFTVKIKGNGRKTTTEVNAEDFRRAKKLAKDLYGSNGNTVRVRQ